MNEMRLLLRANPSVRTAEALAQLMIEKVGPLPSVDPLFAYCFIEGCKNVAQRVLDDEAQR